MEKNIEIDQTVKPALANSDSFPHKEGSGPSHCHSDADDDINGETAQSYLDHLLNDGCKEGDSGAELALPSWYDEQLFKRGQSYLSTYRFVIFSGMLTGLIAVLAVPSILKVLVCTRQSDTPKNAYRRYVRTIFHTQAWYNNPIDATQKDSKFWTSVRAVRDAHARSSRACAKLAAGQITQKDLALTQFGFIGFITVGAPRIQMYDQEFLEATTHMWRVLGYLLGIKDEYNICARNWAETRPRLVLVMRKIFAPALEQSTEEFYTMTKAMLNGLWCVNSTLTVGSQIYFTKRLAYCKGYEYFKFDYWPGTPKPADDTVLKLRYNELGWWDRFIVAYGLILVTFLHKHAAVRWYLNFRVWLMDKMMYYLPYLAIWKWGIKSAYVRIYAKGGKAQQFEYHLKED